jgi:hypothetical protein
MCHTVSLPLLSLTYFALAHNTELGTDHCTLQSQVRPRGDSIHTSNSTNTLFQANLVVITPGYTPKDLQVNVTK